MVRGADFGAYRWVCGDEGRRDLLYAETDFKDEGDDAIDDATVRLVLTGQFLEGPDPLALGKAHHFIFSV
jgi:hypothetical protein